MNNMGILSCIAALVICCVAAAIFAVGLHLLSNQLILTKPGLSDTWDLLKIIAFGILFLDACVLIAGVLIIPVIMAP